MTNLRENLIKARRSLISEWSFRASVFLEPAVYYYVIISDMVFMVYLILLNSAIIDVPCIYPLSIGFSV